MYADTLSNGLQAGLSHPLCDLSLKPIMHLSALQAAAWVTTRCVAWTRQMQHSALCEESLNSCMLMLLLPMLVAVISTGSHAFGELHLHTLRHLAQGFRQMSHLQHHAVQLDLNLRCCHCRGTPSHQALGLHALTCHS